MGTWILTSGRAKAGNMFILTWKSEVALSPKSTEVRVQVELARTVPAEDHKWSCLLITPTILFILNITRHGEYLQFRDHGYFYSYWKIRKKMGRVKWKGSLLRKRQRRRKAKRKEEMWNPNSLTLKSPALVLEFKETWAVCHVVGWGSAWDDQIISGWLHIRIIKLHKSLIYLIWSVFPVARSSTSRKFLY